MKKTIVQLVPQVEPTKYKNVDLEKFKILQENKGKSGIYMFQNFINRQRYIGSAQDLFTRLLFYYSNSSMEAVLKRSKSHICSALLKDGRSNFSLEILEYCEPEKCLEREGYYLKQIKPEYNIAKDPTAPMSGRIHSDESRKRMSDIAKKSENSGRFKKEHKHSDEIRKKIYGAKKGQPKIDGSGSPSQAIEVFYKENNQTTIYGSISEAARALNIKQSIISMYLIRNQTNSYDSLY